MTDGDKKHGYADNSLWDKLADIGAAVTKDPEETPEGVQKPVEKKNNLN